MATWRKQEASPELLKQLRTVDDESVGTKAYKKKSQSSLAYVRNTVRKANPIRKSKQIAYATPPNSQIITYIPEKVDNQTIFERASEINSNDSQTPTVSIVFVEFPNRKPLNLEYSQNLMCSALYTKVLKVSNDL